MQISINILSKYKVLNKAIKTEFMEISRNLCYI